MRILIFISCLFIAVGLQAQALRDINYNYLYNPASDFTFNLKPKRGATNWSASYKLQLRDTTKKITDFQITWEIRKALTEKTGQAVVADSSGNKVSRNEMTGMLIFPVRPEPEVLVAKVIDTQVRQAWLFYQILEPNFPGTYAVQSGGEEIVEEFVSVTDLLTIDTVEPLTVSYYNDNFPVSLPPFSESQGRVAKGMRVDSAFVVQPGSSVRFDKKGLYLIQRDTNAAEGLALRAEDDYPKFTRVPNLAGPMVYICTKQEYDRLTDAKVDKKVFDRVVLSMTNDTERAKKLIRNYFRRVEQANQFFTSYKEGWKTDRGMVFIVFGIPDEVYKFQDREVWYYNSEMFKANFTFLKSPTLFDPDNYVLIRDRKFQQTWYEVIDLWRNARF